MKLIRLATLIVAASLLALAGCASNPGGKLQRAGATTTFDMQIDTELDWARIKSTRQEVWTIDGTALNSLMIYSGVKPNEHVFMAAREKRSRPDGPWFRPGMRADEVRDIVVDALRGQGWSAVTADNLRPQAFGSVEGLRFELSLVNPDGLAYRGTVAAAERNGKLTVLFWKAPTEYYHDRDAAAVARMLDGIRFVN